MESVILTAFLVGLTFEFGANAAWDYSQQMYQDMFWSDPVDLAETGDWTQDPVLAYQWRIAPLDELEPGSILADDHMEPRYALVRPPVQPPR